jgi:hypothetical protein
MCAALAAPEEASSQSWMDCPLHVVAIAVRDLERLTLHTHNGASEIFVTILSFRTDVSYIGLGLVWSYIHSCDKVATGETCCFNVASY